MNSLEYSKTVNGGECMTGEVRNGNGFLKRSWSPYVVGAGIGVLSWFAFASVNKPIGITSAFENTAALIGKTVVPQIEQRNPYFAEKTKENKLPKIDWEWMLVLGVFVGSFISSKFSGDRSRRSTSPSQRRLMHRRGNIQASSMPGGTWTNEAASGAGVFLERRRYPRHLQGTPERVDDHLTAVRFSRAGRSFAAKKL